MNLTARMLETQEPVEIVLTDMGVVMATDAAGNLYQAFRSVFTMNDVKTESDVDIHLAESGGPEVRMAEDYAHLESRGIDPVSIRVDGDEPAPSRKIQRSALLDLPGVFPV